MLYLLQGYFSKSDVRIIRALHHRLCAEITPHALTYIDAWAIPKECLAAPIATGVYARL